MSEALIESVSIGVNRNGSPTAAVNLYNYGEATNLTLGQLVNAICCRAGFALETESVALVNFMTAKTRRLKAAAQVMETLVSGTEKGYDTELTLEGYGKMTAKAFLTDVMGYTFKAKDDDTEATSGGSLPYAVDAENDRLAVYTVMKKDLDAMTTESQTRMIDLQSCMSRRDVAFSTATNVVQTLGGVLQAVAANY